MRHINPVATQTLLVTAEEFFRMPDDNYSYELVRGRLIQMPKPSPRHGFVATGIGVALYTFVTAHDLGVVLTNEVGFMLASDPDTVRAPDISFLRRDRIPATGLPDFFWPGAPDLAIEVRSKTDRWPDVLEKVDEYLRFGTQMVWVIDPKRLEVMVFRPGTEPITLARADELDGSDIVPGFRFPVRRLFE